MANRAYLYATGPIPEDGSAPEPFLAVGESRYPVPHLFKLACSHSPRRTASLFPGAWYGDARQLELVIEADFAPGVEEILTFLDRLEGRLDRAIRMPRRLDAAEIRRLSGELRDFITDPRFAGCSSFVLDATELFVLVARDEAELEAEAQDLLGDCTPVAVEEHDYGLQLLVPDFALGIEDPFDFSFVLDAERDALGEVGLNAFCDLVWMMPASPTEEEPGAANR